MTACRLQLHMTTAQIGSKMCFKFDFEQPQLMRNQHMYNDYRC